MDYLIKFQMNIFTLIILVILFGIIKKKAEIESFGQKILKASVLATAVAIIMEPLTWIFDSRSFFGAFFLEYSTNFLLILCAPVIGSLMLIYVDYYVFHDLNRIKRKFFYLHATIATFILLIINAFYPIYFHVNSVDNSYVRDNLAWIHYIIIGLMYVYMAYFMVRNRKKTYRYVIRIFIFFFFLPFIGIIIQLINNSLLFSWNSIALAILVCYIFLESTSGAKDYLTQLYSRQSYETYVHKLMEQKKPFTVVMIDLDKFKHINDEYGHLQGDHILIEFSRILEHVFYPNKLVGRLAGDEFIIVVEKVFNKKEIISDIYDRLTKSEEELLKTLTFSLGFKTYEAGLTMDDLYFAVDRKMYANKER